MTTFKQYLIKEQRRQLNPNKLGSEQKEPKISQQAIDVAKQIVHDCRPYLSEHDQFVKHPLYRGSINTQQKPIVKRRIRKKRNPKDMPPVMHNIFNDWFKQNFGKPYRSVSVFTTGSRITAEEYGHPYVVFPIGNFDYVWSRKIDDLLLDEQMYQAIHQLYDDNEISKKQKDQLIAKALQSNELHQPKKDQYQILYRIVQQQLEQADITDQNLTEAVKSDHEIMIAGDTYYTIPLSWYIQNQVGELVEAVIRGDVEKYI